MNNFDRLLRMKAFKPRIFKGLPQRDLGENGDFGLATTSTGLILYIKFNNEWWQLTHGKRAAARGTGREIGAYKDTFHNTATAHRIKLISRQIPPNADLAGIIRYNNQSNLNSGFHLGDNDNLNVSGAGVIRFTEQTTMGGEFDEGRDVIILKREDGILKVRNADDTSDKDIQCANIKDGNSNKSIEIVSTADAVNHLKVTNSPTGSDIINSVVLSPDGSDASGNLQLTGKGSNGKVYLISSGANSAVKFVDYSGNQSIQIAASTRSILLTNTSSDIVQVEQEDDGELRIWTTSASDDEDISINASGDLRLASGNGLIALYEGSTNSGTFGLGTNFGFFSFATADSLRLVSALNKNLNLESSLGSGNINLLPGSGDVIIDKNSHVTTTATTKGLHIDYDHTGISASGQTVTGIGLDLDMNCESVTHVGNVLQTGIDIDIVAATDGIQYNTGMKINTSGGDSNRGIEITTPDGATGSRDIRIYSSTSVSDYCTISTGANGVTKIETTDGGGNDADLEFNVDGDITLNSTIGNFIAENNGTEFSAANSAYAGMILGYTDIGLDEGRAELSLTTSYVVPTDEFSVAFTSPPSGNVEIEIQIVLEFGSSGLGTLEAGLSSANATSGYTQLEDFHEEQILYRGARAGKSLVKHSWTLTGLSGAQEIWVGFKSTTTTGTPKIHWGGNASGHSPSFIIKAIALPATITT
jgi:hypothetical protein